MAEADLELAIRDAITQKNYDALRALMTAPGIDTIDLHWPHSMAGPTTADLVYTADDLTTFQILHTAGLLPLTSWVNLAQAESIFLYLWQSGGISQHKTAMSHWHSNMLHHLCCIGTTKMLHEVLIDEQVRGLLQNYNLSRRLPFHYALENKKDPEIVAVVLIQPQFTMIPDIPDIPEKIVASKQATEICEEFRRDYEAARLRWIVKLDTSKKGQAKKLYCMIVSLCDEYLCEKSPQFSRFFAIVTKLPMELQWKVANVVYDINVDDFSTGPLDEYFRQVLADV